jgi:hypothetical protein
MELKLIREIFTPTETLGSMFVDGVFFCYTLEDAIRPTKIKHETAIWKGNYRVILSISNRFKRLMPEVLNVSGFEGIRIHGGNTHLDSSGCILVGEHRYLNKPNPIKKSILNWIQGTQESKIKALIQKAINKSEKVYLTII